MSPSRLLQAIEHRLHLVGADVLEAQQARHELILRRRVVVAAVDRNGALARAVRLDDLEHLALGLHRQPHRLQRRQEHAIDLGRGDRVGRDDRDLRLADDPGTMIGRHIIGAIELSSAMRSTSPRSSHLNFLFGGYFLHSRSASCSPGSGGALGRGRRGRRRAAASCGGVGTRASPSAAARCGCPSAPQRRREAGRPRRRCASVESKSSSSDFE